MAEQTATLQPIVLDMKRGAPLLELILCYRKEYRFLSNFSDAQVHLPAEKVPYLAPGEYPPDMGAFPPTAFMETRYVTLPEMWFGKLELAYFAWRVYDQATREAIQKMEPGEAKAFSRTDAYRRYLRKEFVENERIRAVPMYFMLRDSKFNDEVNPAVAEELLATGHATLIEGTTWKDVFFGIDLLTGQGGENFLGRMEMTIRDLLRVKRGMAPVFDEPLLPTWITEHAWPFIPA